MTRLEATREAYGRKLASIGDDPRIVVVDADLSTSTKTVEFAKKYPERFINVGVAEQNLLGIAAGLAYSGKIVFASTYAAFITRAVDQLRFIAHDNLDVKVVATHGGLTDGPDGWTHHSIEDVAITRSLPNMKVVIPADAVETERVVEEAVKVSGPWYVRLSRVPTPVILDEGYKFVLGRAYVLEDGSDVAIIAAGNTVAMALEAARLLRGRGVSAAVINMSTVKPLDVDTVLSYARRTGAIVTAEEHNVHGGLGSAVAEVTSTRYPVPIEMVGIEDRWGPSGETEELWRLFGLTPENIASAAERAISRRR